MKRVDFFIVGEPKSGTTALRSFLNRHPQIYMPDWLEPHFFCDDLHRQEDERRGVGEEKFFGVRSLKDYERLFEGADESKIWGEKSVHYLLSRAAARNIYKYNPEAKIIVMLREPVSFLGSLYGHYLMMKMEAAGSLERALELEKERRKGKSLPERLPMAEMLFYWEAIEYAKHLRRFYEFFDKKAVKVIFYEDFDRDNRGVYREVLGFLGVEREFDIEFGRVNVRRRFRHDFWFWLTQENRVYRRVMDGVPLEFRKRLSSWCDPILFDKVKGDGLELGGEMRRRLDRLVAEEAGKLSRLLGVDVKSKWRRK